jgi:hypothetical protein
MFGLGKGKKHNGVSQSRIETVNSYVLEILRAILKEELKTDLFFTRSVLVPEDPSEPKIAGLPRQFRPTCVSEMNVSVFANFSSLDCPRPHTRENIENDVPLITGAVTLTEEKDVLFPWEIFSVALQVSNYGEARPITKLFIQQEGANGLQASQTLLDLSKEFRFRAPVR